MRQILNNRTIQIIAIVILSVIAVVLLIQTYGKANRPQGFDLTSYLTSAEALMHGQNPYETGTPFPYLYPLTLAFVMIPLAVIPYSLAVFLWYSISIASLVLVTKIIVELVSSQYGVKWGLEIAVPLAALSILLIPVIQNNLLNGQVNLLVLALCVLFLKYHVEHRDGLSATMLALAASIKIVPAIFVLYLIIRRRYKAALLTIVLAGIFCLLPALLLGGQATTIYSDWFTHMTALASTDAPEKGTMFFTLAGFLSFMAPPLGGPLAKLIASGLVLVAALAVDILGRSKKVANHDAWSFALYLLAILLVLPISETHHLALLIPAALLIMFRALYDVGLTKTQRYTDPIFFSLFFWIGKINKNGPFYFIAILCLFIGVAVYLSARDNNPNPELAVA